MHELVVQTSGGEVDNELWLPFKVCCFVLLFAVLAGLVRSSTVQPRRPGPYQLRRDA